MTKFEEDLNKKMDLKEVPMYFTQSGCSMTRKTYIETNWIFDNYKNWHSDEELQEHFIANKNLIDVNTKLAEEIANLKSQLQQQALPVVPEDVAKWIEELKSKGYSPLKNPVTYGEAISDLSDESLEKILTWISQHQEEFMRAWLDGYTVEKPQLFYLKNKLTGDYLAMNRFSKKYSHHPTLPQSGDLYTIFPKQEIDSMQTGSYEQIKVEVEK